MRLTFRHAALSLSLLATMGLSAPTASAQRGTFGLGPLVGSAPGADLHGSRVPTVGVVGDLGILRVASLGFHLSGTLESRAGAQMTGVSASLRAPLFGRVALRVGAATGAAEVQRASFDRRIFWRDWRGVDAGLELFLGRTTGALVVRSGTIDQFASVDGTLCGPDANCLLPTAPGNPRRFFRVSFESRYTLF